MQVSVTVNNVVAPPELVANGDLEGTAVTLRFRATTEVIAELEALKEERDTLEGGS